MKKNIALVTGGISGESVISYRTAKTIGNNLDREQFSVYTIDINPAGWFYVDGDNKIPVDKNDFSVTLAGNKINFDAVFIAMHGTPGEDGKLQGYFDMLGIPYTGCNAATSAITFNKRYGLSVASFSGIDVSRSVLLIKGMNDHTDPRLQELQLPVFVKPNNGGSSIGMSKVDRRENIPAAIEKAFREDREVLVEEFIRGREFTVGVFRSGDQVIVLPLTEVKADSSQSFFDFEAKYEGKSSETTPAEVDETVADKVRQAARKIYTAFNCKGVVRIDFIYNEEKGRPFMLEVNSIPGQSEASVVPVQVRAMGWSLQEFYTKLLREVLP